MICRRTALLIALGVVLGSGTPGSAFVAAPTLTGARITNVAFGSPAQRTGLEVGDLIVAIDGQPIRSTDDFSRLTANKVLATLVIRDVRTGRYLQADVYPRRGLIGVNFRLVALPTVTLGDFGSLPRLSDRRVP